ncbi:hypothetical protein [Polaribacter sp. MED152]|uniref:hypothetical protein n=1 Tax=Polaribacter sp. MED152 TaxID=313598 RepID=UPI0000689A51|nr:hypothetical protein [Polaribacter sp. MED152]EAQ40802.1 hypothetical protein MED152_12229 [Polaribacter sp. MED152]
MKKYLTIFVLFLGTLFSYAQSTKPAKKNNKIDTVKTEVIEVVTTYNPEIADANKIKQNPTIKLLAKSKKKKLKYTIYSAPVASTFIPKSGVAKSIDVGVKERIYNNFLALGYGNFNSPYVETYLHNYTRFQSEFGLSAKYTASLDNIENTKLNSDFSNLNASIFYKKEERYFDWTITLKGERNTYNWYGIDEPTFTETAIGNIDESQTYNYFNLVGDIDFIDAYITNSQLSLAYFTDYYNSAEYKFNLNTNFDLPLDFLNSSFNNIQIKTGLEYLGGSFEREFTSTIAIDYSIFTAKINPEYNTKFGDFSLKLGFKFFTAFDTENEVNHFLVYPDIQIQKPILKDNLTVYAGVLGNLNTNTYKDFSSENPFLSPTQFITQTNEKYNAFLGFNGILNKSLSYNLSATFKDEEDKALFVKNYSKSNGANNGNNGILFRGYEYGNSFSVVYDDVQTISLAAEIEYDVSKQLSLSTQFQFNHYESTTETEAWNLPNLEASFSAKYKTNTWYANTNIFFVGERKDILYSGSSFNISGAQTLDSFVDVNLNGGYHFSDKFSAFVKLNNVLNNNYQRFSNFNVQGFQVLGGLTYKFDF